MTIPITSDTGRYNYTLDAGFQDDHVAEDLEGARKKAYARYDPTHKDRHRVAVTVIVRSSLMAVRQAQEVPPKHPYRWTLVLDNVDAVTYGPSGLMGADGDPGQFQNTHSVVVSGYGVESGIITHIAASQ